MACSSAAANDGPPNIIMILVDDMSWSSTSVQMDPNLPESASDFHQTPRIAELASRGMTFSNGYSAGPICSPSRAALLSGISPAQFHVTDVRQAGLTSNGRFTGSLYNGRQLTPPQPRNTLTNENTIAEHINELNNGYRNGFFGKFDWWPHARDEGYHAQKIDFFKGENRPPEDPAGSFGMTNLALDFLEQEVNQGRPVFTTIAHEAVKLVRPRPETVDRYRDLPPGERHFDPTYAASHEDLDTTVGLVLDKIDELGIADNTYVIFTADHGAPIGPEESRTANEPHFGGKGTLYEGGVRVPYLIAGPGVAEGSRSDVPVTGVDLFSTIYDIAGGEGPADPRVEGTSLVPLLENNGVLPEGQTLSRQHAPNGELFFHYPHYGNSLPGGVGPVTPASAIRDGDYKLVQIYGENGADDELLLFDLAANQRESSDSDSPLNLASQLPDVVDRLAGKLADWLQAVDASLPYDIRDEVTLSWQADSGRGIAGGWFSEEDVDFRDREQWRWRRGNVPSTAPTAAFQPGVAESAIVFDGTVGGEHRFFHVGDSRNPDIDSDHSATFGMWLRFDSLDSEQYIFGAGGVDQGLSLSLGDADSDGSHNDLRLRLRSRFGEELSITAPVDLFADATEEFVYVSAVVGDAPGDPYLELFVNGVSLGRVDGDGVNPLDWDDFSLARFSFDGATIPAPATGNGEGDLPFTGGVFRGELAGFRFSNTSTAPAEVQALFANQLTHPALGVGAVQGDALIAAARPGSTALGQSELDGAVLVIHERLDTLDASLTLDVAAAPGGPVSVDGVTPLVGSTVDAGTDISSYLVHFDPETDGAGDVSLTGSLTFAAPILGLIVGDESLDSADRLIGSGAGLDLGDRSVEVAGTGIFSFSDDLRTLFFDLVADASTLTQLRVVTGAPLAGDYDGDGVVGDADYQLWLAEFGVVGPSLADGNLDGRVDAADFTIWRDNLGAAQPGSGSATTVPEPGGLLLGGLLAAVGLGRRERRD